MPTLEERIQRLEDESAIRTLVARFADACVHADVADLATTWSPRDPDVVWVIAEPFNLTATGVPDISALFVKLRNSRNFFIQGVHSGLVEIEGGGTKATARWILREIASGPGDEYYGNYAVYYDDMEKVDGAWYFVKRVYQYVHLDSAPFTGNHFKLPKSAI